MAVRKINPWLKMGLEFGPLLAFFVAFMRWREDVFVIAGREYTGFILATAGFIPLIVLCTLVLWRLTGRLAPMQVATIVLVVVFGGLSVWLNDPRFFKMKPTLIYLLFAAILGTGLAFRRSWLALVMEDVLPMQAEGWRILTLRMIALFVGLAVANEAVWRLMSEEAWVYFKTFGLSLLMVVFFMSQARLFERYALPTGKDGALAEGGAQDGAGQDGS